MHSTTETRAKAQAILDYIAKHPEKHSQSSWNLGGYETSDGCGTSMCIGGTATWLAYGRKSLEMNTEYEARNLLGLSETEAEVLFFEMSEKRALMKLEKVAAGEEFTIDDFYVYDEKEDEELGEEPRFVEYFWDLHVKENPHLLTSV